MPEPRFGNCRDCAAMGAVDAYNGAACMRHPPAIYVVPSNHEGVPPSVVSEHPYVFVTGGCWDFVPKPLPSPPETDNG